MLAGTLMRRYVPLIFMFNNNLKPVPKDSDLSLAQRLETVGNS